MLPEPDKIELRAIPECAGYSASADGRIWSHFHRDGFGPMRVELSRPPRELRPFDRKTLRGRVSPYLSVNLTRNGKRCNRFVHELVLLAWVGPRPRVFDLAMRIREIRPWEVAPHPHPGMTRVHIGPHSFLVPTAELLS